MKDFSKGNPVERVVLGPAYERARQVREESTLDPKDFINPYDEAMVMGDIAYVADMEKKFGHVDGATVEESEQLGAILEAITADGIDLHNWLGQDAETLPSSRFDDIANGIDAIVEIKEGEHSASHLALAVDVTSRDNVVKKIDRIIGDIDHNHLTEVKYFHSDRLGVHGIMKDVPRVVIGADREHVLGLTDLWLQDDKEGLAKHPVQFQIVQQVLAQLTCYERYARKKGKEALADRFSRSRFLVEGIAKQKGEFPQDYELRQDRVHDALMTYIENFDVS